MKLYADTAARRTRQILVDVAGIAWVVVAIVAGVLVHNAISVLAEVGRQVQSAGDGFAGTMADIGDTLSGIPFVGDAVSVPFAAASDAGGSLAAAGQAQQDAIGWIAAIVGVLVALGPILFAAAVWVVPRLVLARRAAQVKALALSPDGPELLALRALATRPIAALRAVDAHPLEGWRSGDRRIVRGLADLELRRAGVRLPG